MENNTPKKGNKPCEGLENILCGTAKADDFVQYQEESWGDLITLYNSLKGGCREGGGGQSLQLCLQ